MKKININGRDYIKLSELRHEIKKLKDTVGLRHGGFTDKMVNAVKVGYGDIIRVIYKEELEEGLKHAHTPEEIKAVHESIYDMPGDFIVFWTNPTTDSHEAFHSWKDGKPVVCDMKDALIFNYKSKAKEVAERLKEFFGDDWIVMDISDEAYEDRERLLKAIFKEQKYTKQDAETLRELLSEFLNNSDEDEELKDRLFDEVNNKIEQMIKDGRIE